MGCWLDVEEYTLDSDESVDGKVKKIMQSHLNTLPISSLLKTGLKTDMNKTKCEWLFDYYFKILAGEMKKQSFLDFIVWNSR